MEENPYRTNDSSIHDELPKKNGVLGFLKKILIVFGVILGLLIVLIIWAGFSTSKTHGKFEGKAEPFIESFLSEQSPWNYSKAKPKISIGWFEVASDEDSSKLFEYFNKLGAFDSIGEITWDGCTTSKSTSGSVERCNYIVSANYERGPATIYFGLSFEKQKIKIMQLKVNSNVFMQ